MDFLQAEAQFRQLDAQYKAGQISYDQYKAALFQLQVIDASGNQWQLQELTGQWYTLSNGQWIAAQRPVDASVSQTPLSFAQAEQQFAALEAQYQAGQITMEYYRTVLAQLQVTDASQNVWQMQERTGAWHVLSQGQWVAATPPGAVAPPMIAPPQPLVYPQAGYPPATGQPKKRSPWGVIGIVGGGLLLVALAVVGISALLKGGGGSASTSNAKTYNFKQESSLTLNPGGGEIQDELGTRLQVAAEALPAEDSVTNLTTYSGSGQLEKELSQSYKFETPFYEVTLEGANDGSGPAVLTFPAPNADSRLLMIIDKQAAILLAAEPQNGVLTVDAHLGPTDLSVLYPEGDAGSDHSVLYAVVTPLKPAAALPAENAYASSIVMASNIVSREGIGKSCSPVSIRALTIFQRCQSNEDGTVMVIYPSTDKMTSLDAYNVAKEIESAMTTYAGKGYTNASLSASSPMLAVVSDGYTSPEYNFKNGVIYLPPDIPVKISSEKAGIWHETGHWIQNRVYSMAIARVNGNRSWWMDVSAELMVMDVMPEYIADNLSTYGKVTNDNETLVFQSAPYQWPSDFYVHAQLVKVNMCELGCPLTESSFRDAINVGRYPFNGNYEREQLTANLEDYARYLVGAAPLSANSGISLAGVQSQDGYGQVITAMKGTNALVKYLHNGAEPQIKEEKTQTVSNLLINAPLEADGVYPLEVTSGSDSKYAGLPLMLVIEPGVPYLYRLDGGEVISSDGSEEKKLGPLQAGTGVGTIRLVAFSKTGGQSFKAKLEPVNLDGTWVIQAGNLISSSIQCSGGGVGDEATDPNDMGMFGALYFGFFEAAGEMTTDSSGQSLDWALVPGRLPAEIAAGEYTFEATAITETDGIRLQGKLNIPKPSDSSGYIPGIYTNIAGLTPDGTVSRQAGPIANSHNGKQNAGLAVVVLLPALGMGMLPLSKKRRNLMIAAAIGMMVLSLAGCIGLALYGSFEADVKITKFEYAGGSGTGSWTLGGAPSGNPIWVFKEGTASYPIDFFIDVTTTDSDGKETTSTEECSGTATYALTGGIYEDMTVSVPSNSD